MNDSGAGDQIGPQVAVTTPEDDVVLMRLTQWRQAADRSWWACCALSLWSVVETPESTRAEPFTVENWVPAGKVEPVPGEDYSEVPRHRAPDAGHSRARRGARGRPLADRPKG